MNTNKNKPIKPASTNPVKEAKSHPDGPSLEEMLNGQEEKKPQPGDNSKNVPDIPVI
jgi:hypothetical protein